MTDETTRHARTQDPDTQMASLIQVAQAMQPLSKPPSPTESLLGRPGAAPLQCRVIAEDVAVHWYPQDARVGDPCMCGKSTMRKP